MLEFIIENYYVILVICILLIFAIIGYIIDTLKNKKEINQSETYIPEEEIFLENTEKVEKNTKNEENSVDSLIEEYNSEQNNENSNVWVF